MNSELGLEERKECVVSLREREVLREAPPSNRPVWAGLGLDQQVDTAGGQNPTGVTGAVGTVARWGRSDEDDACHSASISNMFFKCRCFYFFKILFIYF